MDIKEKLQNEIKDAMRAKDRDRLAALRLIHAAIKQKEIDDRVELDDTQVLSILDKMLKQRKESLAQFEAAGRTELAEIEKREATIIGEFMPKALTDEEIDQIIRDAIQKTGASSMQDMGKVMGMLKPQLQGRADMGAVSGKIKTLLNQ